MDGIDPEISTSGASGVLSGLPSAEANGSSKN
jgi:hypothetical protein